MIEQLMKEIIEIRWSVRGAIILDGAENEREKFRITEPAEKKMISELRKYWKELQKKITTSDARQLIDGAHPEVVFEDLQKSNRKFIFDTIRKYMLSVAEKADSFISLKIRRFKEAVVSTDRLIQEHLNIRLTSLVDTFTDLSAVKEILKRYIVDEPVGAETLANKLKEVIGLDERSVRTLNTYRDTLANQGLSQSVVNEMVRRRREELISQRALKIARTEISYIYNHAQLQRMKLANTEGWFPEEPVKIWRTAQDERLCPYCQEMDGETVRLSQNFSNGKEAPPYHVNCRCTVGYRILGRQA